MRKTARPVVSEGEQAQFCYPDPILIDSARDLEKNPASFSQTFWS
jgi:hypothetical protein